MFDTYRVESAPSYKSVSITEKRAPTDESVLLLKEMEHAAAEKLLESVRVANCGIDVVIHRYEDYLTQATKFLIIYKLNGEQRRVEHSEFSLNITIELLANTLWKALADDIAACLLKHAWKTP